MKHVIRAVALALALAGPAQAAEEIFIIPPPAKDVAAAPNQTTAVATLAGGCFWGVQGVFQRTKGVLNAVSGYAGGPQANAKYELVSDGDTGHAEAVQITYDPRQISYGKLLQIFFSVAHNPTELNRQGPDEGTQYRSTIFPANEAQAAIAKAYIAQLDATKVYGFKIATTLEMGKPFYPAEDYHQDYLTLNPHQPYIAFNDMPKIDALKKTFPDVYRAEPVLVSAAKKRQ